MKKIFFILTILVSSFALKAQQAEQTCHFGMTFEISNNPCWGFGEPVVLSVEPFSQAEKAGIKAGDIIMEINSTATYLRDYKTIFRWFYDNSEAKTFFTIRNMNTYFKEYALKRECNDVNSLSESQLASSFSFYSLDNVVDRSVSIPTQIVANTDVDYSDYHTFDFIVEKGAPQIDARIAAIIENALIDKGLTRNTKDPDFYIQTYYGFQPNAQFNGAAKPRVALKTWRYNPLNQKMELLPILPVGDPLSKIDGQYILELGIRFFDKKLIDPNKLTQIWDCSTIEYVSEKYSLEEYAKIHVPLIMMTFPYATNRSISNFTISFKKHNYTGLYFNTKDMSTVSKVDEDSPAWNLGIRKGDVVRRINSYKLDASKDELTNAYKRFLIETMKYRDAYTRFTDANGYPDCMYWDKSKVELINKVFQNNLYMTYFAYLFDFDRFVNPKPTGIIEMEVEYRNHMKKILNITPEVRNSVSVQVN